MLQQLFGGVGDGPVPLKLTPNSTETSKQANRLLQLVGTVSWWMLTSVHSYFACVMCGSPGVFSTVQ